MKIDTDLFDKVLDITGTDYNFYWRNGDEDKEVFVDDNTLLDMIEDLVNEVNRLKEVQEDIITDRNENYELKKIDHYKEYGISEDNFH